LFTQIIQFYGPNKEEIDDLVGKLAKTFKIDDQGKLSDYMGIKIEMIQESTQSLINTSKQHDSVDRSL
jgi:hypothetical protein